MGGSLVDEGRRLINNPSFVQEGTVNGWAIYDVSVDRNGNIKSATLKESNITRTSSKVQLRNYVVTMKFEKGTHYPQFHHANIKLTLVKPN